MTDEELVAEFQSRFCSVNDAAAISRLTRQEISRQVRAGKIKTVPNWPTTLIVKASLAERTQSKMIGRPRVNPVPTEKRPVGRPRKDL